MYEARADSLRFFNQFNTLDAWYQLFKEDAHLHACQQQAKALVRSGAKSQVAVGFSLDVELMRVLEQFFIETGSGIHETYCFTFLDGFTAQLVVARRCA